MQRVPLQEIIGILLEEKLAMGIHIGVINEKGTKQLLNNSHDAGFEQRFRGEGHSGKVDAVHVIINRKDFTKS